MELNNRTILITGGSSGIGLALAKQFAHKRCQVIVCSRSQSKLDTAKQEISMLKTIRCDINSPDDLNSLVSYLSCNYPKLDTLINNAGIQYQLDLADDSISDRDIITEINTNFTAQILITRRLFHLLSSNNNSAIIFTGSALGFVPKYSVPVYSASKAAVNSFAQSLRAQYQNEGKKPTISTV
jgi:short-subunit dehydrogenase involved in D-alanine esterification of teichoic acids